MRRNECGATSSESHLRQKRVVGARLRRPGLESLCFFSCQRQRRLEKMGEGHLTTADDITFSCFFSAFYISLFILCILPLTTSLRRKLPDQCPYVQPQDIFCWYSMVQWSRFKVRSVLRCRAIQRICSSALFRGWGREGRCQTREAATTLSPPVEAVCEVSKEVPFSSTYLLSLLLLAFCFQLYGP